MSAGTHAAPGAAAPGSRQRRAKPVNYPHQRVVRLGQFELDAVESVQSALTTVRGRAASFSEAFRLIARDKLGAAEVEARAQVLRDGGSVAPVKIPPDVLDKLDNLDRRLSHVQGSLGVIAKSLAYARKGYGTPATHDDVSEALAAVHEVRDELSATLRTMLGMEY